MQNLLLSAKFLAIESGDSNISKEHIRNAIIFLEPRDLSEPVRSNYIKLCKALNLSTDHKKIERMTHDSLMRLMLAPRIEFDNKAKEIIASLAAQGIYTTTEITQPYSKRRDARRERLAKIHKERSASAANNPDYHSYIKEVAELKNLLCRRIYDQEQAIESVCDAVLKMRWSEATNKPAAIFSFLGPAATGKTYMATLLAEGLKGFVFKSFDMTQFTNENEGFGLVGLREGFRDACHGKLTSFVQKHPRSIIVFDEFEKAHTKVQTSLLRIFSEGRLKDEYTEEDVDFSQTIVILTSNLGSSLYANTVFLEQVTENPHQARDYLLHAIAKEKKIEGGNEVLAIRPEMLSRLSQGSVVLFNKMSVSGLIEIAKSQLQHEQHTFNKKLGVNVDLDDIDHLAELLLLSFAPAFDTREIKSKLTDRVFDVITDYLIANSSSVIKQVKIQLESDVLPFLIQAKNDELPNQLLRKHQRVYFETKVTLQNDILVLQFGDVRIEKLSRQEDFEDSSGIQVDLPEVSFDHIAGHHEIKKRLLETLSLVTNREKLREQKITPPKGMLLYGVPGTGKTMLAKAFAHEADLPFIACSGGDLLSETFIKKLFQRAREYAPSIIFIDEIDALPKRGVAGPSADLLINRMLVEIDGFIKGEDIFIIAATNRKELLDPALIRSGRIDLHYEVPQLDKDARRWFVEKMLSGSMFHDQINVDELVLLTAGMSGADLEKTRREVILQALRNNNLHISAEQIIEQINTLKYGAPLDKTETLHQLEEVAYHEAAHAVISRLLVPHRRIEQVTVVARANFLGMVSYDQEQQHDHTKEFLFGLTCVALAGRAAQVKKFGSAGLDSGASGDLKQAANYAFLAISEWGMTPSTYNLPISAASEISKQPLYKELIETEVKAWIDEATNKTDAMVEKHWNQIETLAKRLLIDETVSEYNLNEIMEMNNGNIN